MEIKSRGRDDLILNQTTIIVTKKKIHLPTIWLFENSTYLNNTELHETFLTAFILSIPNV